MPSRKESAAPLFRRRRRSGLSGAGSALPKRKIGAAGGDKRRADEGRGRWPIAEHDESRKDHPNKLGVLEWSQRRRRGEFVRDDEKAVPRSAEGAEPSHDEPDARRLWPSPNERQQRREQDDAGQLRPEERRQRRVDPGELPRREHIARIAEDA